MTDLQFKDFLRGVINDLERIKTLLANDDADIAHREIDLMLNRFKATIQS